MCVTGITRVRFQNKYIIEKCRKNHSGYMWRYVAACGFMLLSMALYGFMWLLVALYALVRDALLILSLVVVGYLLGICCILVRVKPIKYPINTQQRPNKI